MINDNLYTALKKIYTTEETSVKAYRQVFTYEKVNDTFRLPKELLTYDEGDKRIRAKGRKYVEETAPNVFKEKTETDYMITVVFDFYGERAEEFIRRLVNVLNINDNKEFSDEDLSIYNYQDIKNLTDLENSKYKERFSISVDFGYKDIVEVGDGYEVKTVDYDLVNADG